MPPPPSDLPRFDPQGYQKFVPDDPWDRPYVYESDGRSFRIVCLGADGLAGGDGYDQDIDSSVVPKRRRG